MDTNHQSKREIVNKMGYSGAEVPGFLGVTTSGVNRLAKFEQLPGVKVYINCFRTNPFLSRSGGEGRRSGLNVDSSQVKEELFSIF
jgi:hypothetical protein